MIQSSILWILLVALAACAGPYVSGKHKEGAALLEEQKYEEAIRTLQEAVSEAEQKGDPRATVSVRNLLGWAYAEAMRFEEAEREARGTIRLAEQRGLDTALLYAQLSIIQSKAGSYQEGLASAEQALSLTAERWKGRAGTSDRDAILDYAVAHHGWPPDVDMLKTVTMAESSSAVLQFLLGNDRQAVQVGERALKHFEAMSLLINLASSGERREFFRGRGVAAGAVSRAYRNLGNQEQEQEWLMVAKDSFRKIGIEVQGDEILAAYAASGKYATAARMTAGGFKPDPRYSEAFNEADRLYFDGDYGKAVPAFRSVIERAKGEGKPDEASRALSQLGWLLAELGRYAEAIRLLRESVALSPQEDFTSVTYARLSAVEARLGSYDQGLEDAERALTALYERRKHLFQGKDREAAIDVAMKNPGLPPDVILIKGITSAEGGRTTIHYFRGDYRNVIGQGEKARRHYADVAQAVLLAPEREQISYFEGYAWVTLMVGDAYINVGEIQKGRALVEESRDYFKRARLSFGDVVAEGLTAYSHVLEGNHRKGAELLKTTLARVEADGLEELKWHLRSKFAEQLITEARLLESRLPSLAAITDPAEGERVKRELFSLYAAKTDSLFVLLDQPTAARFTGILKGLEEAKDAPAAATQVKALAHLLKEEAYRNDLGAADNLDSIRSALETDLNKRLFQANKQRIYGELIVLATELYGAGKGFEALERAKARGLVDLLATKEVRFRNGALLQEERDVRAAAGDLLLKESRQARGLPVAAGAEAGTDGAPASGAVAQLVDRYRGIVLKIKRAEPELASLVSPAPLTYESFRPSLSPDVTLLEYFPGEDRLYVWVVEAQALSVRTVPIGRRELTDKIRQFRQAIANRDRAEQEGLARGLYDLLIRPVKPLIHGKRLGIVPYDSLHYLPFQALHSSERYLIQDSPLFFAPSAAVLQHALAKDRPRGSRLLAFGNPDLGNPELDLPYAQAEVEALAALYPSAAVRVRGEASEAAAKEESGRYDVLHFASHAEFSELDPLYTGLRLAMDRERREDGRLAASEVFALDLKPYLVTLSACQTGLGVATSGDEVIGMNRAFIYAGAPSIVASLWSVSDLSTAKLMEAFYRNLRTMPKDEALQKAQVALLGTERFGDPFYWAPFYLTGDWK
ncbi:MAG: CHAT domain-containing tetratricopeptide repeat protein [Nitrospirota bacterium]